MEFGRISASLTVAGLVTAVFAGTLIWLLLYQPAALAGAVNDGDFRLVVEALGTALLKTVASLARYL